MNLRLKLSNPARAFSYVSLALVFLTATLGGMLLSAPSAEAALPTWNFTVKIGMPSAMVTKYGGKTALESKINAQLATVSSRFTGFNANITFTANNFYTFTDTPPSEIALPHTGSNFLLIYDEGADQGGWFGDQQAILHDWAVSDGGAFAAYATDGLVHEFGHTRGAVDIYQESVTAANNPINGTAFNAPTSIMKYPYGVTTWDPYTTEIMNASGAQVYLGAPIVDKAFPQMRIKVLDSLGHIVPGAKVTLYPVGWGTNAVQTTVVQSGITNTYGNYVLTNNPFQPGISGHPWNLADPNFLIKVTSGGHTGYAWLPLTGVGRWYFENPGTVFTRTITLK